MIPSGMRSRARRLRTSATTPSPPLSNPVTSFHESILNWSCATARITALAGFSSSNRGQPDPVFMFRLFGVGQGIVDLHVEAVGPQRRDDVDHPRVAQVADVFLEGETENRHDRTFAVETRPGPAPSVRLTTSLATKTPMPSLMRRPERMTCGM